MTKGSRRMLWVGHIVAAGLLAVPSSALALSYWLENGLETKAICPGSTGGRPLKIANGGGDRFLITAVAICTDTGESYKIKFNFLSVRVNPAQKARIDRDVVEFDWVGLAVYKAADPAGNRIEWLFDEARMIDGSLERTSSEPVYFGDLEFVVPKSDADAATHFTFYLTWKGPLETFGVL